MNIRPWFATRCNEWPPGTLRIHLRILHLRAQQRTAVSVTPARRCGTLVPTTGCGYPNRWQASRATASRIGVANVWRSTRVRKPRPLWCPCAPKEPFQTSRSPANCSATVNRSLSFLWILRKVGHVKSCKPSNRRLEMSPWVNCIFDETTLHEQPQKAGFTICPRVITIAGTNMVLKFRPSMPG